MLIQGVYYHQWTPRRELEDVKAVLLATIREIWA
jgi:hypothetical protein